MKLQKHPGHPDQSIHNPHRTKTARPANAVLKTYTEKVKLWEQDGRVVDASTPIYAIGDFSQLTGKAKPLVSDLYGWRFAYKLKDKRLIGFQSFIDLPDGTSTEVSHSDALDAIGEKGGAGVGNLTRGHDDWVRLEVNDDGGGGKEHVFVSLAEAGAYDPKTDDFSDRRAHKNIERAFQSLVAAGLPASTPAVIDLALNPHRVGRGKSMNTTLAKSSLSLAKYGTRAGAEAFWRNHQNMRAQVRPGVRPFFLPNLGPVRAAGLARVNAQHNLQQFQRASQDVPGRYVGGRKRQLQAEVDRTRLTEIGEKINLLRDQIGAYYGLRKTVYAILTKQHG